MVCEFSNSNFQGRTVREYDVHLRRDCNGGCHCRRLRR